MTDLDARLKAIGADRITYVPYCTPPDPIPFGIAPTIEPGDRVVDPIIVASDVHRTADAALDQFIERLDAELTVRAGMKGYWRRAPNHIWDRDYETDTERHVYRCRLIFVPEDAEAVEP